MSIYVSLNLIVNAKEELKDVMDQIQSSTDYYINSINDTLSTASEYLNDYKILIGRCEKEISSAKNAIQTNQNSIYKINADISRLKQRIADLEWEISTTKIPSKPSSTGNPDIDKANREEWEDEVQEIKEYIAELREEVSECKEEKDSLQELKDKIEENIKKLNKIIDAHRKQIEYLRVLINNLERAANGLRKGKNEFIDASNSFIKGVKVLEGRLIDGEGMISSAINTLKTIDINLQNNSIISVDAVDECKKLFFKMKDKIVRAYDQYDQMSISISEAQRNLTDNITKEAGYIVNQINDEYQKVLTYLENINKVIDHAFDYLKEYEQL